MNIKDDPVKRPRKVRTNVTLDSQALALARDLGLNVSALADEALAKAVQAERNRRWRQSNRAGLEAQEKRLAKYGAFSDGLRRF